MCILYSRKLSREKTFTNFVDLEPPVKVFSLESFPLYGALYTHVPVQYMGRGDAHFFYIHVHVRVYQAIHPSNKLYMYFIIETMATYMYFSTQCHIHIIGDNTTSIEGN